MDKTVLIRLINVIFRQKNMKTKAKALVIMLICFNLCHRVLYLQSFVSTSPLTSIPSPLPKPGICSSADLQATAEKIGTSTLQGLLQALFTQQPPRTLFIDKIPYIPDSLSLSHTHIPYYHIYYTSRMCSQDARVTLT